MRGDNVAKRDYYEVLGVGKTVEDKDLKKAYRKKAMEFHPDRNPDNKKAEEKFKEVNEAYEILSDPEKRAAYDNYGHAAFEQGGMGGPGGFGGFEGGFGGFGGFEDIFGDLFGSAFGGGSRQRRNSPMKGQDIRYRMNISFEEAAFGTEKEITITREDECGLCHGTGAKPGTSPKTCPTCNGIGQVNRQVKTPFGTMNSTTTCPNCNGTGEVIEEVCPNCHGSKVETKKINKKIRIPAGVDDGATIRLTGEGNQGMRGGPKGDVYIIINVSAHKLFKREGYNVWLDIPISFVDAAIGAELKVPTLDGEVKYKIPEGTQTGTVFRMKGKGITFLNSDKRGDQLIKVTIQTPKKLTNKQKEALMEYDKLLNPKKYSETDKAARSGSSSEEKIKKEETKTTNQTNTKSSAKKNESESQNEEPNDSEKKGFFKKVKDFMEGDI